MAFDYSLDFQNLDFQKHPELYKVGVGEQGVLLVEPYKSQILPHWRFKTAAVAEVSSQKIYEMFEQYLNQKDFVGADMARKFLQMGFTRSRRYANYQGGRKYKKTSSKTQQQTQKQATKQLPYPYSQGSAFKKNGFNPQLEDNLDSEKGRAAQIFKSKWDQARQHPVYLQLKAEHQQKYGK